MHTIIHAFKPSAQTTHGFKRRRKESLGYIQMPDEPVRAPVFSFDIEAATEDTIVLKHAKDLTIGSIFIREGMKTVERQHKIKAFILKWQRAHVSLLKVNIRKAHILRAPLCYSHHVRRII